MKDNFNPFVDIDSDLSFDEAVDKTLETVKSNLSKFVEYQQTKDSKYDFHTDVRLSSLLEAMAILSKHVDDTWSISVKDMTFSQF